MEFVVTDKNFFFFYSVQIPVAIRKVQNGKDMQNKSWWVISQQVYKQTAESTEVHE